MAEELAGRIAAGEVVERPASIVKELVENAIDAGATEITVDLEKGGKKSIRVTDNGSGIEREQVALAFQRNATSKIYEFEDIYRIRSFGFRGEALYSIASISEVEMYTKIAGAVTGTRIVVENGAMKEISDAGCPQGTSLRISRIFAATPVRMKFLKADSTELGHCIDAVVRCALANPKIKVTVNVNGKSVLAVPRTGSYAERISLVLGDHVERETVSMEHPDAAMELIGFVSRPRFTLSNARGMMFYVNGRYVRDSLLHNAVMSAYRRLIEPRRYPSSIIFLDLPAGEVDINVHPTKREVRFKNPSVVFEFVAHAIANTLSSLTSDTTYHGHSSLYELPGAGEGNVVKGVGETDRRYTIAAGPDKKMFTERHAAEKHVFFRSAPLQGEINGERGKEPYFSSLRYIGRVSRTYLLFTASDAIVVIDQHAAHERILFEKLRRQLMEAGMESQRLLLPELLTLNPALYATLIDRIQILNELGFEVEPYGPHTVIVKSIPSLFSHLQISIIMPDIIDELVKSGKSMQIEALRDAIAALLACRGAVKAGESLTEAEIDGLCRDLDDAPYSTNCPHGRPAFIIMNNTELERLFKR